MELSAHQDCFRESYLSRRRQSNMALSYWECCEERRAVMSTTTVF
jgi:hypothetical protein